VTFNQTGRRSLGHYTSARIEAAPAPARQNGWEPPAFQANEGIFRFHLSFLRMTRLYLAAFVFVGRLLLIAWPCAGQTPSSNTRLEAYARHQVQRVTQNSPQAPFYRPLLETQALAIAVVEPLLFSIYGEEEIRRQRPYKACFIKGFWYLSGTLPTGWKGGTFEIIVEAQNGRIWHLTHGK
jgi:hypothetical protein